MPLLLQNIDAIAREKRRDVLTVEFHDSTSGYKTDHRAHPARKTILAWFDVNDIPYYPCGPFASNTIFEGYNGQVYIDVPYDSENLQFQQVQVFLENPDGSTKHEGAWLTYYPLEACMKNVHHDEQQGMRDSLADKF